MLKATAGGGGIGMYVCNSLEELRQHFESARDRGKSFFANSGVYLEKYYPNARRIEVQIFGNGKGKVNMDISTD